MTNKEKYLKKIAGQESKAMQQAKWRNENREWLIESQKLAVKILLELDRKKMTQKELAEAIGKSPQYVNKLLRGNEKFGFEVLVKIQNALHIGLLATYESNQKIKEIVVEEKYNIERFDTSTKYSENKVIHLKSDYIEIKIDKYQEA
ncbi:MAG: helix-turn-helix domain-containing protein [Weeksellaceae bacterium]